MLLPYHDRMLGRGAIDKEHAMSQKLESAIAVTGIDIGNVPAMELTRPIDVWDYVPKVELGRSL